MIHTSSELLNRQGNEHFARGFYTDAYLCYVQALECDRASGDRRSLVMTLGNLGNICAVSGRGEHAQVYYQEVLELQKILGDERGIGTTLANLGNLRADAGVWDRARAYYLEALDIMRRSRDEPAMAVLYSDLGFVARETGQYDAAMVKWLDKSILPVVTYKGQVPLNVSPYHINEIERTNLLLNTSEVYSEVPITQIPLKTNNLVSFKANKKFNHDEMGPTLGFNH